MRHQGPGIRLGPLYFNQVYMNLAKVRKQLRGKDIAFNHLSCYLGRKDETIVTLRSPLQREEFVRAFTGCCNIEQAGVATYILR